MYRSEGSGLISYTEKEEKEEMATSLLCPPTQHKSSGARMQNAQE